MPAGQPRVRRQSFSVTLMLKKRRSDSKAVADGAVSYFLDHFVEARMSKFTYGTKVNVLYDPEVSEHLTRSSTIFTDLDGARRLPGAFSEILQKVSLEIDKIPVINESSSRHIEYSGLAGR